MEQKKAIDLSSIIMKKSKVHSEKKKEIYSIFQQIEQEMISQQK